MYGGFERLSQDRTIVSEVLSQHGYRTGGFHSNLYLSEEFGYGRGFDTLYDSKTESSLAAQARQFVKQNLDQNGLLFQLLKRSFEATEKHTGLEIGSAYVRADDITDRAIKWLQEGDRAQPTFLWVHYMDVHHPYVPPDRYQTEFREEAIDERDAVQLRRKMLEEPSAVTTTELQDLIDLYDAEIRFTDAHIKRLVQTARRLLDRETVVLFTSDHGEEFGEHGKFSHNTLHDEGIRVPFIVHDGRGNGDYRELVGLLDVSPTLLGYAEVQQPDNFYGYDLGQLLRDRRWPRDAIIGNWGQPEPGGQKFFYRDHDWKYFRLPENEQLFDLRADPGEKDDVLSENPAVANRIRAVIDEHVREVEETSRDLGEVEMDDEVRERLELLGYNE
jgi:arylsulfatase A-like enzyme